MAGTAAVGATLMLMTAAPGDEGVNRRGSVSGPKMPEWRAPGGLAVEGEVGHRGGQHRQGLLHLGPGQVGAQAVVRAAAEGEVRLALGGDVEVVRARRRRRGRGWPTTVDSDSSVPAGSA